jgi:hypothetical protein
MTKLVTKIERRDGADVGYHESPLHPADGSKDAEKRVGKRGFDKTLSLEDMIGIASRMEERPNIIVKAGLNAKWYLKRFPKESIDVEIEKQQWRPGVKNCTMWVVEW